MGVAFYLIMSVAIGVLAALAVKAVGAEMGPVRLSVFAVLLSLHIVLHWFALRLSSAEAKSWVGRVAYWVIQGGLVFGISLLTGHRDVTLGLWVMLLAETAALLWPEWWAIALSAGFYISLMFFDIIMLWGLRELLQLPPWYGLAFAGILVYALVLAREGRNRLAAQEMVRKLEAAQRQLQEYADQVEALTISHERQRMAREMHDTLAQGLAGVIMQLEAADSHLESNQPAEARLIVQQSMQRARQTLHEARRAIQALRSAALEQKDLAAALAAEVAQFEATSGVVVEFVSEGEPGPIGSNVAQHVLRILQESLSNVGRHSQARHVWVRLVQGSPMLQLVVQDDGKGFDVEAAMLCPGCFGLQGMYERAQRLGGTLRVESAPRKGTRLELSLEDTSGTELGPDQRSMAGMVVGARAGEGIVQ
jgi:NarL family two-component system sensor histidine kinase YdfH